MECVAMNTHVIQCSFIIALGTGFSLQHKNAVGKVIYLMCVCLILAKRKRHGEHSDFEKDTTYRNTRFVQLGPHAT